jgi:hypothetical protein
MSTAPAITTADQINAITTHISQNVQPIAAAMIAVEQVAHTAPGQTKLSAVMTGVQATAMATAAISPNITVQAIAGLASLLAAIFNATGIFQHGAPPNIQQIAPQQPQPAQPQ